MYPNISQNYELFSILYHPFKANNLYVKNNKIVYLFCLSLSMIKSGKMEESAICNPFSLSA